MSFLPVAGKGLCGPAGEVLTPSLPYARLQVDAGHVIGAALAIKDGDELVWMTFGTD